MRSSRTKDAENLVEIAKGEPPGNELTIEEIAARLHRGVRYVRSLIDNECRAQLNMSMWQKRVCDRKVFCHYYGMKKPEGREGEG